MQDLSIRSRHIADNTIVERHLVNGQVTLDKLGEDVIAFLAENYVGVQTPLDAARLQGHPASDFALATHNHDAQYLGLHATADAATKLATVRTINGVGFDGTADIVIGTVGNALDSDKLDGQHGAYYTNPANIVQSATYRFVADTEKATWNAKQAGSSNLTSLAGLAYVSASFVKMTGANTFTLDTNTYSLSSHNHTGVYQPLATNLTAIGALANGAGWLKNDSLGGFSYSIPTKSDVGLGNVDNTADANKAVLSATKLATARAIQGVNFDGTAAINIINGTGFVKASGTALSYDNSTYSLSSHDHAGLYQPLENQRLSSGNSVTFAGLTLNGALSGTSATFTSTVQAATSYSFSTPDGVLSNNNGSDVTKLLQLYSPSDYGRIRLMAGTTSGYQTWIDVNARQGTSGDQIVMNVRSTPQLTLTSTGATFASTVNTGAINASGNVTIHKDAAVMLQKSGTYYGGAGGAGGSVLGEIRFQNEAQTSYIAGIKGVVSPASGWASQTALQFYTTVGGVPTIQLTIENTGAATFASTITVNGAGGSTFTGPVYFNATQDQLRFAGGTPNLLVGPKWANNYAWGVWDVTASAFLYTLTHTTGNATYKGSITSGNDIIATNASGQVYLVASSSGTNQDGIILKEAGTAKWGIFKAGGATPRFEIYNYNLSNQAVYIDATNSAATFNGVVNSVYELVANSTYGGGTYYRTRILPGNSDTVPFIEHLGSTGLYGWGLFNRMTDGDFTIGARNNSASFAEYFRITRASGGVTITSGGNNDLLILNRTGAGAQNPIFKLQSNGTDGLVLSNPNAFADGVINHAYASAANLRLQLRGSDAVVLNYNGSAHTATFAGDIIETDQKLIRSATASGNYASGFRLDYNGYVTGQSTFIVDNIIARGSLRAHIFEKDVTRVMNAKFLMTDGTVTKNPSQYQDITDGVNQHYNTQVFTVKDTVFQVGDIVEISDFSDNAGLVVRTAIGVVYLVSGNDIYVTYENGAAPLDTNVIFGAGSTIGRVGNTSVAARSGYILMDANTTAVPRIDIYTGRTSCTVIPTPTIRIGQLSGSHFGMQGNTTAGQVFYIQDDGAKLSSWYFDSTYMWSLSGGTPASAPTNGIVMKANATDSYVAVYGSASSAYVKLYQGGAADWGIKGTNSSGNLIFQLGYTNIIAGWSFDDVKLYGGSGSNFVGIKKYVSAGTDIIYFAGATDANGTNAVFKVLADGSVTMTKATVQTAATGQRAVMTGAGLTFYDVNSNTVASLSAANADQLLLDNGRVTFEFRVNAASYQLFSARRFSNSSNYDEVVELFSDSSSIGRSKYLWIRSTPTSPSTPPAGSGFLYVDSSDRLCYKGKNGTVTVIANA